MRPARSWRFSHLTCSSTIASRAFRRAPSTSDIAGSPNLVCPLGWRDDNGWRRSRGTREGSNQRSAAAAAQRAQRQACLRCCSGTAASAAGLTVTEAHQQGVSNVPVRAGAQSFGAPQTGHSTAAFGKTV